MVELMVQIKRGWPEYVDEEGWEGAYADRVFTGGVFDEDRFLGTA